MSMKTMSMGMDGFPAAAKGMFYTNAVVALASFGAIGASLAVIVGSNILLNNDCINGTFANANAVAECTGTEAPTLDEEGYRSQITRAAAPGLAVGIVSLLLAVLAMFLVRRGSNGGIIASVVVSSLLLVAYIGIGAFTVVVGGILRTICLFAGFNPGTPSSTECEAQYLASDRIVSEFLGNCSDAEYTEYGDDPWFCTGSVADSTCSCTCREVIEQLCGSIALGLTVNAIFCFAIAIIAFVCCIMGCVICCNCGGSQDQLKEATGEPQPTQTREPTQTRA